MAHATSHATHAPQRRAADGQVVGVLLMVFGLGWLLRVAGVVDLEWKSLLSAVLIVLGVGMAVTARGRTAGFLMVLGVALTIAIAATSSVGKLGDLDFIVDETLRPTTIDQLQEEYDYFAGRFELDLTAITFPPGETSVSVEVGVGDVVVTVPAGLAVDVEADVRGGDLVLFGARSEGHVRGQRHTSEDYDTAERKLSLDLSMGGGEIEVRRGEPSAAD